MRSGGTALLQLTMRSPRRAAIVWQMQPLNCTGTIPILWRDVGKTYKTQKCDTKNELGTTEREKVKNADQQKQLPALGHLTSSQAPGLCEKNIFYLPRISFHSASGKSHLNEDINVKSYSIPITLL